MLALLLPILISAAILAVEFLLPDSAHKGAILLASVVGVIVFYMVLEAGRGFVSGYEAGRKACGK